LNTQLTTFIPLKLGSWISQYVDCSYLYHQPTEITALMSHLK